MNLYTDADPNGDFCFVLASADAPKILVSSKVLSVASPVFAALFSPKFAEGNTASTSAGPCQISLPDDDPEAMAYVCQVLHYRSDVSADVPFSLLQRIAVVCNKYDLTGALKGWSAAWLLKWQEDPAGEQYWPDMLAMASVFANHQAFYLISAKLLASTPTKSLSISHDLHELTVVASQLIAHISLQRTVIRLGLQKGIESVINRFIKEATTTAHFFEKLHGIGLWPLSEIFDEPTISLVIEKLRRYKCTCTYQSGCRCKHADFESSLWHVAAGVEKDIKGLCLECVRKGKYTDSEGNCRSSSCVGTRVPKIKARRVE